MTTQRMIFFAPNVGVGGGLVLLTGILAAWPQNLPMVAILDERARPTIEKMDPAFPIHWFRSSISGRYRAEVMLDRLSREHDGRDTIFCFHNLPPILAKADTILCYLHNPNLVGLVRKADLSGWVKLRCAIERFVFRWFGGRITRYIVQTQTMATALRHIRGADVQPIDILPFVDPENLPRRNPKPFRNGPLREAETFDFVYISDGATHKNHPCLIQAWTLLAEQGLFPTLALTLHATRDAKLREDLRHHVEYHGVAITDLGQMPHGDVLLLYRECRALIFPSYAESFGIPLIEATAAGVPILAAEMDFVRDVCEPTVTFDPHSARSIASAVRRFLEGSSNATALLTPDAFIQRLATLA